MSRQRVVDGVDERGRPKTRWADPETVDEPRYGHMQPAYDSTTIQRREATPEQRAAWAAEAATPAPKPPVIVQRARPGLGTPEHVQQGRLNGARRHQEVMAARRAQEEEPMAIRELDPAAPEPELPPSAFTEIAAAALEAANAQQQAEAAKVAAQVAQERFEAALAVLEDAWAGAGLAEPLVVNPTTIRTAPGVILGDSGPSGHGPTIFDGPDAAQPKVLRQPGRHRSSASEEREKAERAQRVMDSMARHNGDKRAVAAELGMKANAVAMVAKYAQARVPA